ncbi:related to alpha/beta fold family hydrolase [Fusarium mangiferae]|uniref:Related to alpha/beta fold family hydrolase n=1 Tax=Fusarium mangiferae TaxID=192010 RepID=A0A1L7TPB0_FUSMA|nr:uncharacterized protein FMAN_10957 [Fusarium mangiferae]CVK96626.1 related to alpha/beta fold family hydrolase [Fusarium mangiferae]
MLNSRRQVIQHANGQTTAYIYDSFTDPWRPRETILIQHGFARTAEHFYHWVPALSRHYNIIRRELRGHGGSSYPKGNERSDYQYSVNTIMDEIKDTLDQIGIEKVHFIGESTSGMLAEIFAATYPERVSSVVVCSSPTSLPPEAQKFLAFGMESWPEACRQLGSRGWATRLTATSGTVGSSDAAYLEWWTDRVAVSDGEGLAGYAEFLSSLDAWPYLKRIEAPMLVLAPTKSALVTVKSMEDLVAEVPNARLEVVESEGHEIYAEAEEQCLSKIISFLEGIEGL